MKRSRTSSTAPKTREAAIALARTLLLKANEDQPRELVERYLHAWTNYRIAQENVARTGAPFDNPYLAIQASAARAMDACHLETDAMWTHDGPLAGDEVWRPAEP